MNTGEKDEEGLLGMRKYFRIHKENIYSREMKSHLAIYNLNGKAARWWRDLKHTKKDEVKEIRCINFRRIFQNIYIFERLFDRKVK